VAIAARCIRKLCGRIILTAVTPGQVNDYIRSHAGEYYEISDGFVFRGITILLESPILVGFRKKRGKILLPFTKPCTGTMLLEVDAGEEDFIYIRERLGCGAKNGDE
jgi:hypothetical protein